MEQALVDGVRVLWRPLPGSLRAGLLFGVGRRDETFVGGGITHLVEHLAMRRVGRTTLECNASVDLTTTEFTACGEPQQVADFLRRACEALSDLPLESLSVEANVLRTENGAVARPVVAALMAERYGATGAGLAGFREPAMLSLTSDDVLGWASSYFVRDNAALWLSGPPPAGLSLPLPEGSRPLRHAQPLRPLTTPAVVEHGIDGSVGLGADVARVAGLGAATRILRDRVEDDLRHSRGLSYSVDTDQLAVDGPRRFVAVVADCREGQEAVVARALWQGVARLAEHGATDAELAHEREGLAAFLADERSRAAEVRAAAESLVTGVEHRTAEQLRAEAAELTGEQVAAAARLLRDGAVVGVPFEAELRLSALAPVPTSSGGVVDGEVFRPRRIGSQAPRRARLVVGVDGVSLLLPDDGPRTVRYSDVVGLLQVAPREWSLIGVDGTSLPVCDGDWRDGARAVDLVRAAVPGSLQAQSDGESQAVRRVLLVRAEPARAFQALWPSKSDAWVAQTPEWTLVVRDDDDDEERAHASAAAVSASVGRHGAVLLLEQAYDELGLVVFQRGRERDRHVWTGDPHEDASGIARALGADQVEVADLLAHEGSAADVIAALERVLGLPPQAGVLLAGADPAGVDGLRRERARGVRDDLVATFRGEYDPPDSDRLLHRMARWDRQRPRAYRIANALAAVVQAALAARVATGIDGDLTSWSAAWTAVLSLSAAMSLWSARPPSPPRGSSESRPTD